MKKTQGFLRIGAAVVLLPVMLTQQGFAWGMDGHMMINRLAEQALPSDVPAFLRSGAALDALTYYGPEPDRWRSSAEPELNAAQAPEHFIDLEYADLAGPLPRRRYDYIRALATAQAQHPDIALTPEKVGLQPYVTTEVYERLQSAFRDYRALLAAKQDTRPSEAEVMFLAGWLGHYVADGSMPLHTSIQYNGWAGPNPHGYTTDHHIHALFESDFVHANVKAAELSPLVAASKPVVLGDVFHDYMAYLRHSNSLVEQTYQLEKAGGFAGAGTPEGRAFVDQQLAAGATELRDMIYTAWVKSADPVPPYRGN
jgi:S1/P1 Nuclease